MSHILLAALAAAIVIGSDGPRFGEVRVATGVRLHYAEQGTAVGDPIILLHGYSDSWFSFSRVLSPLAREAHVYALDLRGHGNSDKPAIGYHMRDLAADVVAFMDAKRIDRATIIGHSMGSFVAQQVALAAPGRVSRLVLVGSARAPRFITGFSELVTAVAALPDPVPESFARDFQVSTVYEPVGDAFIDRAVAESLKLPARVWRGLADGMKATEPPVGLAQRRIPTLLLRGDRDAYMSAAETDSLARLLETRHRKTYRETGHALHWERPAEFARDVLAFRK